MKKDIANHLNNKTKRSHTMGARALEQIWSKGGVDAPLDHAQSVQRTRSSNSEFGRKMLSTNANLIKVGNDNDNLYKLECNYVKLRMTYNGF